MIRPVVAGVGIALGLAALVAVFAWAVLNQPATGSCQFFHYHDYTTTTIINNTTSTQFHHDYICDRYYPLPTDDHGDAPS